MRTFLHVFDNLDITHSEPTQDQRHNTETYTITLGTRTYTVVSSIIEPHFIDIFRENHHLFHYEGPPRTAVIARFLIQELQA